MSSSRRQTANCRSSSVNHPVVDGKFGRMKKEAAAITIVIDPSMMKSQRQARSPRAPSKCALIPAVMRPENAPLIRAPE